MFLLLRFCWHVNSRLLMVVCLYRFLSCVCGDRFVTLRVQAHNSMWAHLYEGGSGEGGGLWHHHLALGAVVLGGVRKRLPIVPCRHGDKVASLWPPGELIGYSSDLKGAWVERDIER